MGDEEKSVDLEYVARAKELVREHVTARYRLTGNFGWTKFEVLVIWCSWTEMEWTVGLKTTKLDDVIYTVTYDATVRETTIKFYNQASKIIIKN